eukprot:CAMPEP_0173378738 /NCGR_PEP_ID=MMETSP1356-20130122/1874_1 /TAXON_ID=77927 ORGANISM="Hemiselmis virescens, Strain PCC157" /NCGR_SAMPLE_ID=MMETSP1356 /ASSEMBLY_ACC=CAM_ASM_000847 /LENGTH=166 /DNA_ID=CAMNT_0014331913 /DNA_START=232 /DNA_END=732 /DNA_ORIENTATION=+
MTAVAAAQPPGPDPHAELKTKIKAAFNVFDKDEKQESDVREIGTILRSLNIFPTEKQLQRWIHDIEEEEPTGFIKYEKFEPLAVRLMTEEALSHKRHAEDEIVKAFQVLDEDKKGYLEADELQRLMTTYGEKFSGEEVKEMLTAAVDVELGRVFYEDYAELLAADS